MRVKIGDQWHSVERDTPILVELSDADRRNIANMADGATMYACFANDCPLDSEQKVAWMVEGS